MLVQYKSDIVRYGIFAGSIVASLVMSNCIPVIIDLLPESLALQLDFSMSIEIVSDISTNTPSTVMYDHDERN